MKKNLGAGDRGLRISLGGLILLVGWALGSMWGLVGLVPLLTGVVGFCPAYCPLKFNTCPTSAK
jgi:hypothetical protein